MNNKQFKRQFGLKIQSLRRLKKITQEDLAERVDRSRDSISNIERGFSSTRLETAYNLAKTLGVTLSELFDFDDAPNTDRAHRRLLEDVVRLLQSHDEETIIAVKKVIEGTLAVHAKRGRRNKAKDV
jgi:transcriptional regulator with XRE-family HTH domain